MDDDKELRTPRRCRFCRFAEWKRTEKGNIKTSEQGVCSCPFPLIPPVPESFLVEKPTRFPIRASQGATCPTFEPIQPTRPECSHEWKLDATVDRKTGGRRCQICRRFQAVDPESGEWADFKEIDTTKTH